MGFGFGVFTVINKLVNPNVPIGYSSIMTAILLLSGIIMLFLGLLGEYIGRIYRSINNAPQYAVKEIFNISEDKEKEE